MPIKKQTIKYRPISRPMIDVTSPAIANPLPSYFLLNVIMEQIRPAILNPKSTNGNQKSTILAIPQIKAATATPL